jgi:hypothetical protein
MAKIKVEEQIGGVVVYLKGDFIGGRKPMSFAIL